MSLLLLLLLVNCPLYYASDGKMPVVKAGCWVLVWMYCSCNCHCTCSWCCCEGIDHLLAQHVAHLFIRDSVSLFREKIDLDDTVDTDHFEVSLTFSLLAVDLLTVSCSCLLRLNVCTTFTTPNGRFLWIYLGLLGIHCRWSDDVQCSAIWSARPLCQHSNLRTIVENTSVLCLSARLMH